MPPPATRLILTLICLLTALGPAAAQVEGQRPDRLIDLFYANTHKTGSGWAFTQPHDENQIGMWELGGTNAPAQLLDSTTGLVGLTIPTNAPWCAGFRVARWLYSDSPGEDFYEWGTEFFSPETTDPLSNPTFYQRKYQYIHMPFRDMFDQLMRDPATPATWFSLGFGAVAGPGRTKVVFPLGQPGHLFQTMTHLLPTTPPQTNPSGSGGMLIGMNLVMQIAVLETNPAPPVPAKFHLSNAIGIQAMGAPPIKINGSVQGNYGPRGTPRRLVLENPSMSFTVSLLDVGGNPVDAKTRIVDGRTVDYVVPVGARSSPVVVRSRTGTPQLERPLIQIVTHGRPADTRLGAPLRFTTETDPGGTTAFGASFIGTVGPQGATFAIPAHPSLPSFDVDVRLYPFRAQDNTAGYGSDVPISIQLLPSGGQPGSQLPVQIPVPLGGTGAYREETFPQRTGASDLVLTATQAQPVDFLAVVRAIPVQP